MKSDLVFGIVLVLGFLAPIFSKALKVPTAVGELFLGIVAGQTLEFFQFKNASDTLSFLSNFGFIMLMFLGGLEIDFDLIKTTGKKA